MPDRVPPAPAARKLRRSVHLWDKAAELVISLGGMAILAAVLGICVYLVWVIFPLFRGGSVAEATAAVAKNDIPATAYVLDEYRSAVAIIGQNGHLSVWSCDHGALVHETPIAPEGRVITSASQSSDPTHIVLGYDDGTVHVLSIGFTSALLSEERLRDGILDVRGVLHAPESIQQGTSIVVRAEHSEEGPRVRADGSLGGVIARSESGDLRLTVPMIDLRDPVRAGHGRGKVTHVHVTSSADGRRFVLARTDDGAASLGQLVERRPLGGGPARLSFTAAPVELDADPDDLPRNLFVTGDGRNVLALWPDGRLRRYVPVSAEPRAPFRSGEFISLVDAPGEITAAAMLAGGQTLVVGDSRGALTSWSIARDPTALPDARRMRKSHVFRESGSPIILLSMSARDRTFLAADQAGMLHIYHGTSEKDIASIRSQAAESSVTIRHAGLAPKNDAVFAIADDGSLRTWTLDMGHPDASIRALFGPMLYEGEAQPRFIYQSSAVTKASEAKISLVPLIFGTLKATIFAMLFAGPIAVMAAVYTSEFLHPSTRKLIKPTIELMAGLPSVVLGLIAAIVLAPYIRDHLPIVLAACVLAPLSVVIGASLWFILPAHITRRLTGITQLAAIALLLAAGAVAAGVFGPAIEHRLFRPTPTEVAFLAGSVQELAADESPPAWVGLRDSMSPDEQRRLRRDGFAFDGGRVVRPYLPDDPAARVQLLSQAAADGLDAPDFRRWLDGVFGSAMPGWLVILIGPALLAAFLLRRALVDPYVRRLTTASPHVVSLFAEALLCLATILSAIALAQVGAVALDLAGFDPRDSIFGPFNARNTLVVGIIMGFAIIPIIFTISEDAMRAVPDSLRQASLGCGATPWQTAARVVIPVAASGIFSACMIGLGRAVGETMIVLMATGGTPEINWNIFAGFRTLAANIAIELPEAQAGSTHYRVLFLCGFVLFLMTIIINTTAELVRQRVRRRNASL
ncbi:MAG: ABC transporter permease subunit [Phycisphaeraceae bacterium]|nr:ABC transporter permease subunit [Phycisphaeraceae bacterium]